VGGTKAVSRHAGSEGRLNTIKNEGDFFASSKEETRLHQLGVKSNCLGKIVRNLEGWQCVIAQGGRGGFCLGKLKQIQRERARAIMGKNLWRG